MALWGLVALWAGHCAKAQNWTQHEHHAVVVDEVRVVVCGASVVVERAKVL